MLSRASRSEVERVRASLIFSIELLAVEAIAVALLTPIGFAQLVTKLAPILFRLRRLVLACEETLASYVVVESRLAGEFADDRLSVAEIAAGSVVATGVLGSAVAWARPTGGFQFATAPTGLTQIGARLRVLSDARQPVIRVEKYQTGGPSSRFIVYLPGTQNLGAANSNPFDMRSNLQLLAGQSSAASRAVDIALRRAGVGPSDQVMLVGYSQGGLIATHLAKQSLAGELDYRVVQVVTVGSPIGANSAVSLPRVLSIENKSDFVPHLDLISNPDAPNWRTLEGNVPADAVQAHEMGSYLQIMRELEASGEGASNAAVQSVVNFATGSATVSYFQLGQGKF